MLVQSLLSPFQCYCLVSREKKTVSGQRLILTLYPVDYFNTLAFHCKEKRPDLTRRVHYKNLDLTITAGLGARKWLAASR